MKYLNQQNTAQLHQNQVILFFIETLEEIFNYGKFQQLIINQNIQDQKYLALDHLKVSSKLSTNSSDSKHQKYQLLRLCTGSEDSLVVSFSKQDFLILTLVITQVLFVNKLVDLSQTVSIVNLVANCLFFTLISPHYTC